MSCYRTTNNKFFTAPPRMADGRHFTDYRPTFDLNNKIQEDNNIDTSYNYRMLTQIELWKSTDSTLN